MNSRSIMTLSLLILTLVACSRAGTPVPDDQANTSPLEPSVDESPLSPLPTSTPASPSHTSPLPDPGSSPIESPSGTMGQAVAAAKARLADELGIASGDIEATAIEPVEWSDASLGCPEPGQMYAQVITPGYRIVLEADGKDYELHTDKTGRAVVICER